MIRSLDWWRYAMDPQAALGSTPPPTDLPCPRYATVGECDANADRCAWYLCAGICLPRGTPPDAVCACSGNASVESCDASGGSCAWYFCIDFCLPTGTDPTAVCGG